MEENYEKIGDIELYYKMTSNRVQAEKAFGELYKRHSPRIFAYCRKFLGNKEEAMDAFQETFVNFFQSASADRSMTNVPAYILKIARNICMNMKRIQKHDISYEDYMSVNFDNSNDKDEMLKLITMALDLLSDEYKEIFILREYNGLSYDEIAKLLNISIATVKIRIYRAKQKLRETLAPYLADINE